MTREQHLPHSYESKRTQQCEPMLLSRGYGDLMHGGVVLQDLGVLDDHPTTPQNSKAR